MLCIELASVLYCLVSTLVVWLTIQCQIVCCWLKICMALVNTRRTTKLIEGGHHRGFQAYRPICYYFYPFFYIFSTSKKRDLLRFWHCFMFCQTMFQTCSNFWARHDALEISRLKRFLNYYVNTDPNAQTDITKNDIPPSDFSSQCYCCVGGGYKKTCIITMKFKDAWSLASVHCGR